MKAIFIYENYMGHATHGKFLHEYVTSDARFDAIMVPVSANMTPMYPARLMKPRVPILHRFGADFWAWRQIQFRKYQVQRALQGFASEDIELVFTHTQTCAAGLRNRFPRATIVISTDATWKLVGRESRYRPSPLFNPLYRLERRIFEQGDLVVSWSQWAADSVINDYGLPAERVQVVHHGVSVPPVKIVRSSTQPFHIGFVGNNFIRKGGESLLRVHQRNFADRAHLTIVSSEKVRAGGLKNVTILRHVPWDELMATIVPAFDIFVLPAIFDYSPYAVIEAMAQGVPVIAGRAGGIPEMVSDGNTGFLLKSRNDDELAGRIELLLDNRERVRQMGENARVHAQTHYSASLNYPRLLDLIAGLGQATRRQ